MTAISITNGNPVIAMILTTLSTFKTSDIISFRSISLSFASEEDANKFFENVKDLGGAYSVLESRNVVFKPDFGGSLHSVRAVYHALNSYNESLVGINKIDMNLVSESQITFVKDIEEYIKHHFGSDTITVE